MAYSVVSGPVIAAGQSLSSVLNVSAQAGIRRIAFPTAWTPGWLTFQHSFDNVTFYDLYYPSGALLVVTVIPGAMIFLDRDIWEAGYYKFRSGQPGKPIIQAEERTFVCALE